MTVAGPAPLLAVERVGYVYPGQAQPALESVDLELLPGRAVGLLGPNGSGKSTLISLIAGLRRPGSGRIRTAGDRELVVAWVPQEYAFYPELTCRENLAFFAGLLDVGRDAAARIDAAIAGCRIEDFADRRARHCSGGMKRRLNLAIALLQRPDVLLLDEPTVGVDPQTRAFLLDHVRTLVDGGTAVLYASHYMEEVAAACSRILLLDRGRVLAGGELDALLAGTGETGPFPDLEALFMHHTHRSLRG